MTLFGIDKEIFLRLMSERNITFFYDAFVKSLVPIESEKKEGRCTKCNGNFKRISGSSRPCPRCNGTGVEPRKEETYKETSAYLASKAISEVVELEAKLSRYKSNLELAMNALDKIDNYYYLCAKINNVEYMSKLDADRLKKIAREALTRIEESEDSYVQEKDTHNTLCIEDEFEGTEFEAIDGCDLKDGKCHCINCCGKNSCPIITKMDSEDQQKPQV